MAVSIHGLQQTLTELHSPSLLPSLSIGRIELSAHSSLCARLPGHSVLDTRRFDGCLSSTVKLPCGSCLTRGPCALGTPNTPLDPAPVIPGDRSGRGHCLSTPTTSGVASCLWEKSGLSLDGAQVHRCSKPLGRRIRACGGALGGQRAEGT